MPKEKPSTPAEQKIEEIKKAFTEPKRGSSLGELRRAMRGGEENPTATTPAEKEIGAAKRVKNARTEAAKPVTRGALEKPATMENMATRLMAEIKKADAAEKEKKDRAKREAYLKQFIRSENKPLMSRESAGKVREVLKTMPVVAGEDTKETALTFEEREATMELEAPTPPEELPVLKAKEIPGVSLPKTVMQRMLDADLHPEKPAQVPQMPTPPKKKSLWEKVRGWFAA